MFSKGLKWLISGKEKKQASLFNKIKKYIIIGMVIMFLISFILPVFFIITILSF